ncbi:MAG: MoaD/ThiS family protein [Planctomycetota bacterium]|jgi:molybdopterin converting factor small subunit
MKIKVKTLLPQLAEAMGSQEIELEFAGTTAGDLVAHLIQRYGRKARAALHDQSGAMDPVVQMLRNEKEWVRTETTLEEGDTVTLMMLMAGG